MKVIHCIKVIVYLASESERLDKLKRLSYGMDDDVGLFAFSDDGLAYVNDPNPGDEALEQFLQLLDLQTLERVQALMYSGRPGEGSATAMKRELHGDSKAGIVQTICEKQMNLGAYFATALDRAEIEKIDIESF